MDSTLDNVHKCTFIFVVLPRVEAHFHVGYSTTKNNSLAFHRIKFLKTELTNMRSANIGFIKKSSPQYPPLCMKSFLSPIFAPLNSSSQLLFRRMPVCKTPAWLFDLYLTCEKWTSHFLSNLDTKQMISATFPRHSTAEVKHLVTRGRFMIVGCQTFIFKSPLSIYSSELIQIDLVNLQTS